MNKAELSKTIKISESDLDALLSAASIPLDLTDYAPHKDLLLSIANTAKKDKCSFEQAIQKAVQGSTIAKAEGNAITNGQRVTIQPVDLSGIPQDGAIAEKLNSVSTVGANIDAEILATAPFTGVAKASQHINAQADALEQHGVNVYLEKFDAAMKDPELVKKVEDKILGKLPDHWNLKKEN